MPGSVKGPIHNLPPAQQKGDTAPESKGRSNSQAVEHRPAESPPYTQQTEQTTFVPEDLPLGTRNIDHLESSGDQWLDDESNDSRSSGYGSGANLSTSETARTSSLSSDHDSALDTSEGNDYPPEELSLGRELGEGAFSQVFALINPKGEETDWVIKVPYEEEDDEVPAWLDAELNDAEEVVAGNSKSGEITNESVPRSDIDQSAQAFQRIGPHPNIVGCSSIVEIDGRKGLLMENIQGKPLDQTCDDLLRFHKAGLISDQDFWGVIQHLSIQLFEGMTHIHQADMVHNDIKPDNLIIEIPPAGKNVTDERMGRLKFIDFGLANSIGEYAQTGHELFAAPEALYQKTMGDGEVKAHPSLDIYAAGIMLKNIFNAFSDIKPDSESRTGAQLKAFLKNGGSLDPDAPTALTGRKSAKDSDPAQEEHSDCITEKDIQLMKNRRKPTPDTEERISTLAKLVNQMTCLEPEKRISAAMALQHPFLTDELLNKNRINTLLSNTEDFQQAYIQQEQQQFQRIFDLSGKKHRLHESLQQMKDMPLYFNAVEELKSASPLNNNNNPFPHIESPDEADFQTLLINLFCLLATDGNPTNNEILDIITPPEYVEDHQKEKLMLTEIINYWAGVDIKEIENRFPNLYALFLRHQNS